MVVKLYFKREIYTGFTLSSSWQGLGHEILKPINPKTPNLTKFHYPQWSPFPTNCHSSHLHKNYQVQQTQLNKTHYHHLKVQKNQPIPTFPTLIDAPQLSTTQKIMQRQIPSQPIKLCKTHQSSGMYIYQTYEQVHGKLQIFKPLETHKSRSNFS